MNKKLTEQIVYHILFNFGVLHADFINLDFTKALNDKQFLLSNKLSFELEDGKIIKNNIYGCQIESSDSSVLKILLGDCTQDPMIPEYCLLVHLGGAPIYGIYMVYNKTNDKHIDSEALIAVSMDNKSWMPCNTYLQATFLAGMERLKDLGLGWSVCKSYKDQHEYLLSFLDFHSSLYDNEDNNEGQEV